MSYADSIIDLETDRGPVTISAYKIKSLRGIGQETEITYTTGGEQSDAWTIKAIVKEPHKELRERWMRALRAWDG